jgi:predicted nucleic acid-binding protein
MGVVDSSVLVAYLSRGDHEEDAAREIGRARGVWAPALVDAEVGHALRRKVLARKITEREGRCALADLVEMELRRVPHRYLVERAWELRHNVTFYDGLYVALAEAMGAPLLTFDGRLARAPGLRAEVRLIAPV